MRIQRNPQKEVGFAFFIFLGVLVVLKALDYEIFFFFFNYKKRRN